MSVHEGPCDGGVKCCASVVSIASTPTWLVNARLADVHQPKGPEVRLGEAWGDLGEGRLRSIAIGQHVTLHR